MKVLHINTSQKGGAAWCAIKIGRALSRCDVDSRFLFAEGESLPSGIDGAVAKQDNLFWQKNYFLTRCKHLYNRLPWVLDADKFTIMLKRASAHLPKELYLHQPLSFYTNIVHHPLVEWADVIHLHWVTDFVDYPSFFKEVQKPIIWTLHDKYPVEGLQHYCSSFFPLPESLKSLDDLCRKIKCKGCQKSKQLHVVAISEMMKGICESSEIFKNIPCTLIHNGVDVDAFMPVDRLAARDYIGERLGIQYLLSQDVNIFMFSSYNIWDNNKGLKRAIDALSQVECNNKLLIVVGNKGAFEEPSAAFPIVYTGLINDQQFLSKVYTSADYFLMTSYEETFSQAPLEAMACGVPVISTPVSGATDLITPFNGVICSGHSPKAIKIGIEEALSKEYDSEIIRNHIVEEYSIAKIAKEYLKLYEDCIKD